MFHLSRRIISRIAATVAILAISMCKPARADLEIWISESGTPGGASKVAASGSNSSSTSYSNGSYGNNLSIGATASYTNSSAPLSEAISSSITLTNTSSSVVDVYVLVGANGFAAPSPPFNVLSSVSGTGAPSSFSFTSYVNNSNGQNATSGGAQGAGSGSNSGSQALNSSKAFSVNSNANPYSITEYFKITLNDHASMTLSSSTSVVTAPEPSSMAIAGIGALGMIGYGLRRRKALGA
jgi:PEP-CTERM motif